MTIQPRAAQSFSSLFLCVSASLRGEWFAQGRGDAEILESRLAAGVC
jgi:hypothetical protein